MDLSIPAKQLALMPIQHRRLYYWMKINQHTPPKSAHDAFILKVYHGLLDTPEELKILEEIDQQLNI